MKLYHKPFLLFLLYFSSLVVITLLCIQCVQPVRPEFEFRSGIIFIDSFVDTAEGNSFVTLQESVVERGKFSTKFITGAQVSFINVDTGTEVSLIEAEDSYLPPQTFAAKPNEVWQLSIVLANGKRYQSSPERVPNNIVEILNAQYTYQKEQARVYEDFFGIPSITAVPCEERKDRTVIPPEGWIEASRF